MFHHTLQEEVKAETLPSLPKVGEGQLLGAQQTPGAFVFQSSKWADGTTRKTPSHGLLRLFLLLPVLPILFQMGVSSF